MSQPHTPPSTPLADTPGIRELYEIRAILLAALTTLYPAVLAYNDPAMPNWPVLYIDTPTGQLSWHINPEHLHHLAGVATVAPADSRARWDHSTKTDVLARMRELRRTLSAG